MGTRVLPDSGDDGVLTAIRRLNSPSQQQSRAAQLSSRDLPPTPQLLSSIRERFGSTATPGAPAGAAGVAGQKAGGGGAEMDEDEARTRRYWKRWGSRAAKELCKLIEKEKLQRIVKRRELVYSARVREPVFRKDADESESDSGTEISLLTTSSVAHETLAVTPKAGSKRRKRSATGSKDGTRAAAVDWEKFARKRSGALDRMMRQDMSALSTQVGGGENSLVVNPRERAIDVMSAEERKLLTTCAYAKGLRGTDKSKSTENVVAVFRKGQTQVLTLKQHKSQPDGKPMTPKSPVRCDFPTSRGCTPTPSQVTERLNKSSRSMSSTVVYIGSRQNSASLLKSNTQDFNLLTGSVPVTTNYLQGVQGLPDFEGQFTKRVRARVWRTVSALQRCVGEGDALDVIAEIPGEKGRLVMEDYSRLPRYPQRVLITPQLASVIKTDIRLRMGRPRCHEILQIDIDYFNKQNPPLDRSHRNLLIFNWLINISTQPFDDTSVPEIVDLEGALAEYRNVLKHDDVMSREPTTLSHVSGGMSDAEDEFSMSAYSREEQEGAVSSDKTESRLSPGMSYLSSSRPDTSHT